MITFPDGTYLTDDGVADAQIEQDKADQQHSEAYNWARLFEAAFIAGNFAEAARLAGERNLLRQVSGL